jgi:hypothetical protein
VTRTLFREVEDMSEHLAGAEEGDDSEEEQEGDKPGEQA